MFGSPIVGDVDFYITLGKNYTSHLVLLSEANSRKAMLISWNMKFEVFDSGLPNVFT